MNSRESWGIRIGLILAMAGNAIGLGNFLRFPVQAAQNGGGAFMIPYFTALLLLGIPLMWVEWTIGRYGGHFGFGSSVGAFGALIPNPKFKKAVNILGVLGVSIPLSFAIYYTYIESWTLAFSFFSVTQKYFGISNLTEMANFLGGFQGKEANQYFFSLFPAFIFFFITVLLNIYVLSKGISKGIESFAKIALPLLFLFAMILVIRVWTLGTPDPAKPENNVLNGIAFLWNPNFSNMVVEKPG